MLYLGVLAINIIYPQLSKMYNICFISNKRLSKKVMRKLNQKQQQTIADNQAIKLEDSAIGLVVAHYNDSVDVENERGELFRCNLRRNMPVIVVGDRVAWEIENAEQQKGVIVALEPRASQMVRRNQRGEEKIIAANVDQILIVAAPEPSRSEQVIDRYLIMTELQNISAGILINKIDLLSDDDIVDKHEGLMRYKRLGYPVLYVSTAEQHGFVELLEQLKNKTTVFVGLSGVGKSSVIQGLLPQSELMVGALSERGAQGRHTTTTARLYHLPEGGNLIDSPGVREFALEGLSHDEILQGFIELKNLAGDCKFRDCQHQNQPGCAIRAAVNVGKIDPLRFDAYQRIIAGD